MGGGAYSLCLWVLFHNWPSLCLDLDVFDLFSSSNFEVSGLAFKSLIHLRLFPGWGERVCNVLYR